MQLNLNSLGNNIEARVFMDSRISGLSIDKIVEDIIKKHYMSQIELSSTVSYDSINGAIYDSTKNERVKLTNKENSILNLLTSNKNSVVATEYIYSYIWNGGKDFIKEDFKFTLRNIILKLRRKLGDSVNIRNKSGVGYILYTENNTDK